VLFLFCEMLASDRPAHAYTSTAPRETDIFEVPFSVARSNALPFFVENASAADSSTRARHLESAACRKSCAEELANHMHLQNVDLTWREILFARVEIGEFQ
jgi:hypothetical protein